MTFIPPKPNGLIKPEMLGVNEAKMEIRVQDNLIVVELGTSWFALSKDQAIKFVQAIAECANKIN